MIPVNIFWLYQYFVKYTLDLECNLLMNNMSQVYDNIKIICC